MTNYKYFATLVFLLLGISAWSQSRTLQGSVADEESGRPLAYATVLVNDQFTYTEEDGSFTLAVPDADAYQMEVLYLGYDDYQQTLTSPLPTEALQVGLQSRTYLFEEILVKDRRQGLAPEQQIRTNPEAWVNQPRDVGELFRSVPGFSLVKRGGFALEPVYRSFQQEQLNIITDGGIQMTNACPGRMDPATTHLSPESIEKAEVISGPYSVRYGLTQGAIINLITEKPTNIPGFSGKASLGYESNGGSYFSSLQLKTGGDNYGFLLNGSLRDFGDYRAGNDEVIPSSFRSYHYAAKAYWEPSTGHELQVGWKQAFERDVDHAGLMMDTESDDSYAWSVDYHWNAQQAHFRGLQAKAYGFSVDHLMSNTLRPNFMMVEATTPALAQTLGGKLESQWILGGSTVLYGGMDVRYLARQGNRTRVVKRNMMTGEPLPNPMIFTDKVWQDAQETDLGLFTELRYQPRGPWAVTAGVRLDQGTFSLNDPDEGFLALYDGWTEADPIYLLTGSATFSYQPKEGATAQLALARGGRMPAMDERSIYHFNVGIDPFEYVGNPDLLPEINYQAELSWQQESDRSQWRASLFASRLHNYVTASVDSLLPRKFMPMLEPRFAKRFTNVEAYQMGGELSGSLVLGNAWQVDAQVAYTHAQNIDWDEPLAQIAPLQGQVTLTYDPSTWWVKASLRAANQQDRIAESFGEASSPAFSVVDLRAGWEILGGFKVGVAVLNVFDTAYYEHLNWSFRNLPQTGRLYEPGRNISILASYQW